MIFGSKFTLCLLNFLNCVLQLSREVSCCCAAAAHTVDRFLIRLLWLTFPNLSFELIFIA